MTVKNKLIWYAAAFVVGVVLAFLIFWSSALSKHLFGYDTILFYSYVVTMFPGAKNDAGVLTLIYLIPLGVAFTGAGLYVNRKYSIEMRTLLISAAVFAVAFLVCGVGYFLSGGLAWSYGVHIY
jgi:hypothetical protein